MGAWVREHKGTTVIISTLVVILLALTTIAVIQRLEPSRSSTDDDFRSVDLRLAIDDDWENNSSPIVAIFRSTTGATFYRAYTEEFLEHNNKIDIPAGKYDVSFVGPIKSDGSLYTADPVSIDTAAHPSIATAFELHHHAMVSAEQLSEALDLLEEAVSQADDAFLNDFGSDTLARLRTIADEHACTAFSAESLAMAHEAIERGDVVFTGTVRLLTDQEICDLVGLPLPQPEEGKFAVLVLDESLVVSAQSGDGSDTPVETESSILGLGESVAWLNYDGMRAIIAVPSDGITVPSDTSQPMSPRASLRTLRLLSEPENSAPGALMERLLPKGTYSHASFNGGMRGSMTIRSLDDIDITWQHSLDPSSSTSHYSATLHMPTPAYITNDYTFELTTGDAAPLYVRYVPSKDVFYDSDSASTMTGWEWLHHE